MSHHDNTAAWAVNPARAGMIPLLLRKMPAGVGKPRASGDDPKDAATKRGAPS